MNSVSTGFKTPRIRETANGFQFILDGKMHGTWRSRSEALVGLATELQRKQQREDEESAREIAMTGAR